MALNKSARDFLTLMLNGSDHVGFCEFVEKDEATACGDLKEIVAHASKSELDLFESAFLINGACMRTSAQRLRVMDLYAYLKINDLLRYVEIRGNYDNGPLPSN